MPCLFPPAIGWPVGGQVLLLALARYGPDMDEIVSDLEAPDRADRFEIPQRPDQAFFESSHPLGLATAELVQVGHAQRVGCSVAGIESMQPQRQRLAT